MPLCRPFDSGKIAMLVVTLGESMTTVNMSDINVLGTSQVPGLKYFASPNRVTCRCSI